MQTASLDWSPDNASVDTAKIPVYIYATVLSSVSIIVGLIWDISWHTSIGRDGLLSPPHLAIYFGGVLAGLFSGYQVLKLTFAGTAAEKNRSLKFWGIFYGSLGPMFCIWGAIAMLTSAPFDDWWHNTYGLDVQILSPPHTVLLLGMISIQFGAMISVLSYQNQQSGVDEPAIRKRLTWLFALSSGFFLSMLFIIASEYLGRHDMHSALFYEVSALLFPLFLVAVSRSALNKWGATSAAAVYSVLLMLLVWILPLFPAEPLLGPVLNHIDSFQAYEFPLLLIVPALVIDLVTDKFGQQNAWKRALLYGVGFTLSFVLVQWPFGDFLMSEWARNGFFGTTSWYFGSSPDWEFRYAYAPWMVDGAAQMAKGLGIAIVIGTLTSRLGLAWGHWMKRIYR